MNKAAGEATQLNKKALTISLMLVMFVGALDITIVSIAAPGIAEVLGGFDLISLLFFTYLLTSSITIPIYGKLADLFGRQKMLTIGICIFALGSALCAMSPSMEILAAARAVQGCGVGAIFTISNTIIGDVFPLAERGKILGLMGSVWGVAGLIGPVIGGIFMDVLSWHWVFIINVPVCLVALIVLRASFKEQFVRVEKRQPMLPRAIFTRPAMIANAAAFLTSAIMIAMGVYLPVYLIVVLGQGATVSGLLLLPQSLTWLVMSFTVGGFLIKYGTRKVMIAAGALLLFTCAWCLLLGQQSNLVFITFVIAITGFGLGGIMTTSMIVAQESVGYENRGAAMGLASMLRTIGQTIGSALTGLFFNNVLSTFFAERGHTGISISDPLALASQGVLPIELVQEGVWEALFATFIAFCVVSLIVLIISLFMTNMQYASHDSKGSEKSEPAAPQGETT